MCSVLGKRNYEENLSIYLKRHKKITKEEQTQERLEESFKLVFTNSRILHKIYSFLHDRCHTDIERTHSTKCYSDRIVTYETGIMKRYCNQQLRYVYLTEFEGNVVDVTKTYKKSSKRYKKSDRILDNLDEANYYDMLMNGYIVDDK